MWHLQLPLLTKSESNTREHWAPKARRTRTNRLTCRLALSAILPKSLPTSGIIITVRLVRISSGTLDDDNLRSSLKACRDGIADALGFDDGDPIFAWFYDQKKCKRGEHGVSITVAMDLLSNVHPG